MDETQKQQTKKRSIEFAKRLGETFSLSAATGAGITFGVMVALRVILPKSSIQATSITTASK